MAKRKSAAKKASRKSTPAKRTGAKRAAAAKGRVSAKAAKKAAKKTAKRATAKKAAKKVAARKVVAKKAVAKKAPAKAVKAAKAPAPVAKKAAAPKKAAAKKTAKKAAAPGTDRASIPSSLGPDEQQSSAARSGGRAQRQQIKSHTETSPAMTGGDVDANWEEAYASGDEAPGGDNPTPDQDRVDEIGKALGVEYEDNEELKGADKISERDKHRWELNPASSDDYRERS